MKVKAITHAQIAARAYQIYLERGCQPGHDVDDWLQAEYELLQLPVTELAKLQPSVPARSPLPDRHLFTAVRTALLL